MPYPWHQGDELLAADLNAAIANAAIGGSTTAGGDLSGTYPNPTVAKINGTAAAASATMDTTNASNITSGTLAGARLPPSGVVAGTYTLATVNVDATGRLLSASNGTQAWQAGVVTTLGAGLSLSSGTLSATATGGGGITDAPSDSTYYARQNATWQHIPLSALTGTLTYAQLPSEVQQVPISFPFSGKPSTGALVNVPMVMSLTIPTNLAGAQVYDATKTTSNAVFTLNKISTVAFATTTWNPSDQVNTTLSGGNLTATFTGSTTNSGVRSVFSATTGKYYFELKAIGAVNPVFGIGLASVNLGTVFSSYAGMAILNGQFAYVNTSTIIANVGSFSPGNNSICQVAIDFGAKLIWFRVDAAPNWNGNFASSTGNPSTGVGGIDISSISTGALYALCGAQNASGFTANFGGSAFTYAVPTGFSPGFGAPGLSTTSLGTVTVTSTSNTSCTLSGAGGTLNAGDVLQIVAPTQDATLADLGITLLASRV